MAVQLSVISSCISVQFYFLILLPNEFQTNEKKTISFRSLVFSSYSINLPSFAKHILCLSIISDCFFICLTRNNTFTKNEVLSVYLFWFLNYEITAEIDL